MEKLNTEARANLVVEFERIRKIPPIMSNPPEVRANFLIANFLREISDTLARIDEKLGGLEMNTRPTP